MKVNVKLLKKVRALIVKEPKKLDMRTWANRINKRDIIPNVDPPCGTIACLAGWAILASRPKKEWNRMFDRYGNLIKLKGFKSFSDAAANLIGIPIEDCPFGEVSWKSEDVVNWIDQQIYNAERVKK